MFKNHDTKETQLSLTSHQNHARKLRWSKIHILNVLYCIQGAVFIPLRPTLWMYKITQVALHYDCSRVVPPWTTQESVRPPPIHEREIWGSLDRAVLEGEPSVLIRVVSALSSDHVALTEDWLPSQDQAVLEDGCSVAKDEVDGALDGAFAVELAEGMSIESVLVRGEVAAVESGVSGHSECHCLMLFWICCVLYGQVSC